MMEFSDLGEIVATRTFTLRRLEVVNLSIGKPVFPPDYDAYCCPYRISGLGSGEIYYAPGEDSVQALHLAMIAIASRLYCSDEWEAGDLLWLGSRNLGLPVADVIRDLVPKE